MFKIVGKYPGQPKETIDECEAKAEADHLLAEYRMAFGSEWIIWIERCRA